MDLRLEEEKREWERERNEERKERAEDQSNQREMTNLFLLQMMGNHSPSRKRRTHESAKRKAELIVIQRWNGS